MEKVLASDSLLLNWCAFYREWFKYTHLNFDASADELCFTGKGYFSNIHHICNTVGVLFGIYDKNDKNLLLYPFFLP